ncbi:MAG: MFS transporter [Candidatus Rokubacteria bacterium]|nr:MFS transporter [Candidatus Rokubacteria bacterium]
MTPPPDHDRWRMLGWISLAELGALSLWFSATAVIPALRTAWLDDAAKAWLSMAVTLGFVVGTAVSAVLTLADWVGARRLFVGATIVGAIANAALVPLIDSFAAVLVCRVVTGLAMAGAYPPGMKLAASWFARDRGFAVGTLVGALTFGGAVPHFVNFLGGLAWPVVILTTSAAALAGAAVMLMLVRDGPHVQARSPFDPRCLGALVRNRGVVLASFGYFGHMWELYAMWAWIGLYFIEAFTRAGVGAAPRVGSLATAVVIGAGGVSCIVAGRLADRVGRTATTMMAMVASGASAAVIGFTFGAPVALVAVALVWGFTIVADSAQFSTAISELAPREYIGTALSLQTCVGFTLTLVSTRLVPVMADAWGWAFAFAFLAPGPFVGTLAMWALRRLPESEKLAHGRR